MEALKTFLDTPVTFAHVLGWGIGILIYQGLKVFWPGPQERR
jgi:hypothetical protein